MNFIIDINSLVDDILSTTKRNNLEHGKQSKTIRFNAPAGYYLLKLNYGQEVKTSILIKQ